MFNIVNDTYISNGRKMLLLFLSLFLNCYLLNCVEFETANFHGSLQTGDELKARRHDNYMNYSTTDVSLTPEKDPTDRITPQTSVPCTPTTLSNETSTPENSTSNHTQDPGLTTPSKYPEYYIYPTYTRPTVSTLVETSTSSTDVVSFYITVYPPGFGPDSVKTEATVDPAVAEFAKKWLDDIASTTATSKLHIPKLGQVFGYDYPADGFPLLIRRNQKTPQRKISNKQLKNIAIRHQTRPVIRQGVTEPQISKRIHPESEAETFWHEHPAQSEESSSDVKAGALPRTRRTQTTVTKQRLKPGLLLGKATIGDDSNTGDDKEDEDEFKKITSESDETKMIMRMHKVKAKTKKQRYSYRTEVQKDVLRIVTPMIRIEYVRHTMFPPLETTMSTTKSYSKMKQIRQETYMIVFLIELSRLVATKEKKAVHDVLKHTDQIVHGYFKSGKLQWFPQTLIHVTKKVAKLLKESDIGVIQKQAADLHHTLKHRSQLVSDEVNRIIEYADKLYADDEGEHLLEALNEFAEYPKGTLSSYWLCNNLINNFLKPYRRLKDTRQRQQLMDSINKALKTRFNLSGASETADDKWSSPNLDLRDIVSSHPRYNTCNRTLNQTESTCETTQTPRERKRKRHHRSHKRKRERKRNRMHKPLPGKESLMLRRTSVQPSELVTS